jgi:hypothetical protein
LVAIPYGILADAKGRKFVGHLEFLGCGMCSDDCQLIWYVFEEVVNFAEASTELSKMM